MHNIGDGGWARGLGSRSGDYILAYTLDGQQAPAAPQSHRGRPPSRVHRLSGVQVYLHSTLDNSTNIIAIRDSCMLRPRGPQSTRHNLLRWSHHAA